MADEQNVFTGTVNQFTQRRNQMFGPQVQNEDGTVTDMNPFNVNVVNELVRRGDHRAASSRYPYEYNALYGGQSSSTTTSGQNINQFTGGQSVTQQATSQQNQPTVLITGADGKPREMVANGANPNYRPDRWTLDGQSFSVTPLLQETSQDEIDLGNKLRGRIDPSRLGSIYGSKNTNGYKFFDNNKLLPVLFARRLGMSPEEVLAMNPFERREQATRLLNEYYEGIEPERKQEVDMIGRDKWIKSQLKTYGFDESSDKKDGLGTAAWNFGKGAAKGSLDQFGNYWEGTKTITGMESSYTDEEIKQKKAEQLAENQARTDSERAILQRFDDLIEDERYEDAIKLVLTEPDAYGAFAGGTLGAMFTDYAVANGVSAGTGAVASFFTGGAAAPAAMAASMTANAALTAKWANRLRQLSKMGKLSMFYGAQGLGMVGDLAREIKLDGGIIDPGSELYNTLMAYGVGATAISALPGTLENTIVKRMMAKGASEELATKTSQQVLAELKRKGYKLTENGLKAPNRVLGTLKFGTGVAAKGGMEAGTEFVQGGSADVIKQAANASTVAGQLDYSQVDPDQVMREGMKNAIPAIGLGTIGGAMSTKGPISKSTAKQDIERYNNAVAFEQKEQQLYEQGYEEFKRQNPAMFSSYQFDAENYNADGTLRNPDNPDERPLSDDPADVEAHRAAVAEALMRKEWDKEWARRKAENPNFVTEAATEPDPVFTPPDPYVIDFGDVSQEDVFKKQKLARQMDITTEFRNIGAQDLVPDESFVKDIRGVNKKGDTEIDVDMMWNQLSGRIEKYLSDKQKKLTAEQDRINKVKIDETLPQQVRDTKLQQREEDIAKLTAELEDIKKLRRDYNLISDGTGVAETLNTAMGMGVFNDKQQSVAEQLHFYLNNSGVSYSKANAGGDRFTRFSDNDRSMFRQRAEEILQEAGVDTTQLNLDDSNLTALLNTAITAVDSSRYGRSAKASRALAKLNVLNTALKTNLPETLYKMDAKKMTALYGKAKARASDYWSALEDPSGNVVRGSFNNGQLKKRLEAAVKTIKGSNENNNLANILDPEKAKDITNLITNDWDSHPVEVLEDIYDKLAEEIPDRERYIKEWDATPETSRDLTQSNDVTKARNYLATINNAMSIIQDMRKDFATGNTKIAPAQNSMTSGNYVVGSKIFDTLLSKLPQSEIQDYVGNVKAIAKAFRLEKSGKDFPPIERDIIGHIESLRTQIVPGNLPNGLTANTDGFKNSAVNASPGHLPVLQQKAAEYLRDVSNRLQDYKNGTADMTTDKVELSNDGFLGGALEAALIDDKDPKAGAYNQYLREVKKNTDVMTLTKEGQDTFEKLMAQIEETNKQDPIVPPAPEPVAETTTGTAVSVWLGDDGKTSQTKVDPAWTVSPNGQVNVVNKQDLNGESVNQFPSRNSAADAVKQQQETQARYDEMTARENYKSNLRKLAWQAMGGVVKDGVYEGDPKLIIKSTRESIHLYPTAVDNLYQAAFDLTYSVNKDATPNDVQKTLTEMMGTLREDNEGLFPEGTFEHIVTTIGDIGRNQEWTNAQQLKEEASQDLIRRSVNEMNQYLFGVGLSRYNADGGVSVAGDSHLHRYIGKLAEAYKAAGYENMSNLVKNFLTQDQLAKARDVKIKMFANEEEMRAGKNVAEGVYGFYDPNTGTIHLRLDDKNITDTLMHEIQHVVISTMLKNDAASGGGVGIPGIKTKLDKLARSLNDAVNNELSAGGDRPLYNALTVVIQDRVASDQDAAATVRGARKYPQYVDNAAVEELLVLGMDRARGIDSNLAEQYNLIFGTMLSTEQTHPDAIAGLVTRWFNKDRYTPITPTTPGPSVSDVMEIRTRRQRKNQFANGAQPNPNNKNDRVTVYHFGFEQSNTQVSADPMAWFDGNAWTFYYVDSNGNTQRTSGMALADVMQQAQALGLHIDQREKDIMYKSDPQNGDQFSQFTPGVAKMWRGINYILGGSPDKVSPIVRTMMGATQKWAVEQHGMDQFLHFYENTLTHLTGTDHEGKLQTEINRIRTQMNAQINFKGVGGVSTMYELRTKLEDKLREIGWSQAKVDDVLYSMRAGEYQAMIMQRSPNDPRWKTLARDPNANLSGFDFPDPSDPTGKTRIPDPDGSKYWATLTPQEKQIANELRTLVTNLNDAVLTIEHQSGRISDKQYNDSIGKFYVPLRNETDEATAFQRRATGRSTKADSPLAHLVANHQARIRAAEQSMIYNAFMDLMEQHPVKGFATFNSSTLKNQGEGEYAMSADGFMDGNTVTFYRKGQKVTMTIQHKAFADALKKRSRQHDSAYFDALTKVTGYLGFVRTATPTFMKTAFLRDMGMAFFNVQAAFRGQEQDFSAADWVGLGTRTLRDMVRYAPMMIKARIKPDSDTWLYNVYRNNGGIGKLTGYDVESVKAGLERDVFEANTFKGKLKRFGEGYLDVLHVSDDAARFSLWVNYLQKKHGAPFTSETELVNYLKANPEIADRARNASKNITGNFEQRGMARGFRSHFMFWNAINAGMRTFYGMFNPKYGMYGITSLSFLAAGIIAGVGGSDDRDEDDKLTDSRMKDLGNVIRFGDTQVPVAQELRPVLHLANSIRFLMDGTWSYEQAFNHTVDGFVQAIGMFTPAQTDDPMLNLAYAVTPTLVQPVTLQIADKTFFGSDLTPTPYDNEGRKMEDAPNAFRSRASTSDTSNWLAQSMYNLTGGRVDVSPNSLDMWGQQALGGMMSIGRGIIKGLDQGKTVPEAVGGLFAKGHTPEYNAFMLQDEVEDRFKKAMLKYRISEDNELLGKNNAPAEYRGLKALYDAMMNEVKAQTGDDGKSKMSDLQQQLKTLVSSESPSPDEFVRLTTAIENLGNTRNEIYGRYNRVLLDMGY